MGERKGGRGEEGEARQSGFKFRRKSKQILSFPECWAQETTSSKLCCCAQTWGHHMCIFSLPFLLPFLFSVTLSLFPPHTPAPFGLYFSPLLAVAPPVSLPGSLHCPRFPLQLRRVSFLLFICEEDLFSSNCNFPSLFLRNSR